MDDVELETPVRPDLGTPESIVDDLREFNSLQPRNTYSENPSLPLNLSPNPGENIPQIYNEIVPPKPEIGASIPPLPSMESAMPPPPPTSTPIPPLPINTAIIPPPPVSMKELESPKLEKKPSKQELTEMIS